MSKEETINFTVPHPKLYASTIMWLQQHPEDLVTQDIYKTMVARRFDILKLNMAGIEVFHALSGRVVPEYVS